MTRLHFIREGNGPFVVLSHALGCDLTMWDEAAALLARAHTVIRYDHRNHGRSPVVPGAFSLQALADDAAGLIREQCAGEPVHFVGVSMGGMTAQALAASAPELLRTITIANSSSYYADRSTWNSRVQTVRAQGIGAIAQGAVARWVTPEFMASAEGASRAAKLRAVLEASDPQGYTAACDAVAGIDFRASNPRISVPTLVIAGAKDEATPPAMSEAIAAAIPGARLVSLDAAHLSNVEQPEAFVAELIDFWRSL